MARYASSSILCFALAVPILASAQPPVPVPPGPAPPAVKAVLNLPSHAEINAPVIASTIGSVSTDPVQVVTDSSSVDPSVTVIPIATPGPNGTWTIVGGLTSFPRGGTYRLVAVAASDKVYAVAVRDIQVGTPVPPVPPIPPGPIPPGPNPPPPPVPPGPTPHGLSRVIVAYETTQPMSKGQFAVLHSTSFLDWLDSHVAKDGSTGLAAWRIWDKDVEVPDSAPTWKSAWDRAKTAISGRSLPAIVVFGSDDSVQAAQLPDSEEATIAFLSQFQSGYR